MNETTPVPPESSSLPPEPGNHPRHLSRLKASPRGSSREFLANALLVALILRVLLMGLPVGFYIDLNSFEAWALHLAAQGPLHFYSTIWSDYPPGYLYVLWAIGLIHKALVGVAAVISGKAAATNPGLLVFLIKVPGALCDILDAWLIFKILDGRVSRRSAHRAALFFAFNPITIFLSAIWGQMDSVLLAAMLGAIYFMLEDRIEIAALLTGLAIMIKPQGAFILPAILATQWFRYPVRRWAAGVGGAIGLGWAMTLPFSIGTTFARGPAFTFGSLSLPLPHFLVALLSPVPFLLDKMNSTAATYPDSSINAFNLWAPTGMWKPDSRHFLFLTHEAVGLLLLGGLLVLVFWASFRQRHEWSTGKSLLVAAIVTMGCFLLPTRMHERYLFPAVGFLALASAANLNLRWNYFTFSATALLNVLYAYFLYYSPGHWWDPGRALLEGAGGVVVVMVNMWVFGDLIGTLVGGRSEKLERGWARPFVEALTDVTQRVQVAWSRTDAAIAGSLAAAFFALGVWNLYTPNEQIFDEIYHARTAKEFIDGTNPYEWTHPHLGKLIIAVGILAMHQINRFLEAIGLRHFNPATSPPPGAVPVGVFDGFDAFGWRISSLVFGSLTLVVVYILTRRLFRSRRVATLATGILALDGVYFVQSRIAMLNIYSVGFMMLASIGLWEFLSRDSARHPGWYRHGTAPVAALPGPVDASDEATSTGPAVPARAAAPEAWLFLWAVGIGLAMASRWSGVFAWGIGLIVVLLDWAWRRRQRMTLGQHASYAALLAVTFVVIPVLLYIASYIPWMLQGHSLMEVVQLQATMYHYHADMKATHNYASAWYTWPLMVRPTWYYFHDWKNGTVSGIDAIGNPAIWWLYLPIMTLLLYLFIGKRDLRAGFLAAFGIGMWLVWGVEPRKLVFMHYMFDAIPFLAIGIASVVDRLLQMARPDSLPPTAGPLVRFFVGPEGGQEPVAEWQTAANGYKVGLGYLVVVAAAFAFFYPILAAIPITWRYYSSHIWFHTWY